MANRNPEPLEVAVTVAGSTAVIAIVVAAVVLRNASAAAMVAVVSPSVVGAVM
jgi:hypothetical protein